MEKMLEISKHLNVVCVFLRYSIQIQTHFLTILTKEVITFQQIRDFSKTVIKCFFTKLLVTVLTNFHFTK